MFGCLRAVCLIRIIVNVKLFSTLDFPVFTTPLFYPLPSVSLSVIFHYLSHVELGYLSASLLTTSSSHSIHPPSLPQGTGSRWISLGAKYTVCACWSLCHMSWWCHFLKSVYYCFVFCALGEEGGVARPPCCPYCICGDWHYFCFFVPHG